MRGQGTGSVTFLSIPPARSPVLLRQQLQRGMWELLQQMEAALGKGRKGVNSSIRKKEVRSPPNRIDWICTPRCTWRRQVRYRKIHNESTDLRLSDKPLNSQSRPPSFLLFSLSLHAFPRTPSFFYFVV